MKACIVDENTLYLISDDPNTDGLIPALELKKGTELYYFANTCVANSSKEYIDPNKLILCKSVHEFAQTHNNYNGNFIMR